MDSLWIVLAIVLIAIIILAGVTIRKARKEEAAALAGLEPSDDGTEGTHHTELYTFTFMQRDLYNELKDKQKTSPAPEADSEEEKKVKKDLAKALMERTMAAVEYAWKFQKDAPEMQSSRQAGFMPDKVWESFQKAQVDLNNELEEIKKEAEAAKEGDGEKIIKNAVEILHAQKRKEMRQEMEKKAAKDKVKAEKKAAKAADHEARKSADELKRKAAAADRAFDQLMAEEDKAAKKSSKGKNKGSAKGQHTIASPTNASSSSSNGGSSSRDVVVEEDDSVNTSVDDIDLQALAPKSRANESSIEPRRRKK